MVQRKVEVIMRSIIVVASAVLVTLGCANQRSPHTSSEPLDASGQSVAEWREYMQSSDDGQWENDESHAIRYNRSGTINDPESVTPLFYQPRAICARGDTIYVTETATMKIMAVDTLGNILWEAGGLGEGPGLFPMVTTVAASDRYIAAPNYMQGSIEIFNRDGTYFNSITFSEAQDIAAISDTSFIVASDEEPGGHLHIVTVAGERLSSFGEAPLHNYTDIPRMDLMRICFSGTDRVAIFNRYEGLLNIYDINTRECIYSGGRSYPMSVQPPMWQEDGTSRNASVGGGAFMGNEGMINFLIPNLMEDGSFFSDPDYNDFAPITAVDRYDWNGNYLDTYCLPDTCINYAAPLSNGRLAVKSYAEGCIRLLVQN
jgi:hypothetical protein